MQAVTLPLDQVPRALAARDTRGLIKLIAERKSGRLIGAHILAPEGGDSIQTAVLAIQHGRTLRTPMRHAMSLLTVLRKDPTPPA